MVVQGFHWLSNVWIILYMLRRLCRKLSVKLAGLGCAYLSLTLKIEKNKLDSFIE